MQDKEKKQLPKEPEIGNSRFTQAMGEAGNIGILATVVSTVAIGAILYFGKSRVNWIHKTIEGIESGFEWIKKKIGNGGGVNNGSKKISEMMASLAAASGAGYFIGHLAMVPAYREGYKKADAEKRLLQERGDMIELLKEEMKEKDELIAQFESQHGTEISSSFREKHPPKQRQHHQPRDKSHIKAVASEVPSERVR